MTSPSNSSSSKRRSTPRSARLRLLVAAFLLAVLVFFSVHGGSLITVPVPPIPLVDDLDARIEASRVRLAEISTAYTGSQQREAMATREAIERIVREARAEARPCANAAAAPFQGFKNISRCVGKGAKDKVTGSTDLDLYVVESLVPATSLLANTHGDFLAALEAFRQRSVARANDYRKDVLDLTETEGIAPAQIGFDSKAAAAIAHHTSEALSSATSAAISVAIEAALIRLTWQSISKVLTPLIAKAAGTASAAGTAAVVDGPVPIGDIVGVVIAIGGAAWTAWDVEQAVEANNALPGQIEASLDDQIDSLRQSADESFETLTRAFAGLYPSDT